jgi:hypothetical protein
MLLKQKGAALFWVSLEKIPKQRAEIQKQLAGETYYLNSEVRKLLLISNHRVFIG